MKHKWISIGTLTGLLAIGLVACGGTPEAGTSQGPTAQPTAVRPAPTGRPTVTPLPAMDLGISGSGEITANQDADLVFTVAGTIAEVKVEEGQSVRKGDLLALLDVRVFDQQLHQAEASLANAQAQESALTEPPRDFDAAAANAQIRSAQAAIAQLKAGPKSQDVQSLEAALAAAQINLQSTKDRLSLAKTQAETQMRQQADALTQAQARYAQAKTNWEYVQNTGNNPTMPESVDPSSGKKSDNKVSDVDRANYYSTYVQAEAAMHAAETAVEQAIANFDTARQAEVTGIDSAEKQVVQAQAALEKLHLPADKDRLAAAQAQLAAANASRARLDAPPLDSQKAQASAAIAQAQAALELAQINREHAELRAPFDGLVSIINIDPGDAASTGGQPAIKLVDVSKLRVDVQISDIDIAKVKEGQTAKVFVDAMPETTFTGKVSYIAPVATVVGNIRTYLVRVTLDDLAGLRAGMSARVDLATK